MPALTLPQAFDLALQHHRAGQLAEAEALYRQILAVQPAHGEAWHFLGVIAHQSGRHDLAIEWIGRALTLDPQNPRAWSNLGEALRAPGRLTEAIAAYERSLSIDPGEASTHYNLGNALRDSDRHDEAIAAFRCALQIQPNYALAQNNLGGVLSVRGQFDEAIAAYRETTMLAPDFAEAWNNLGIALRKRHRFAEAIAAAQRAIELKPDYAEAYNNLGIALTDEERFREARAAYARAIQLAPALAEAHCNLGGLLNHLGRLDEAVAAHRRALELNPHDTEAWNQLGAALKSQGMLAEAIAAHRTAAQYEPQNPELQSNLIYTLHFQVDAEQALAEEQARWNRKFSAPLRASLRPHRNGREPGRRLRIGYVSPDLRDHVVGRNLVPLFRHHDTAQFEILCYADSPKSDQVTEICRGRASQWRMTLDMTDEELAGRIREDAVDILVDLTQHMGSNRLPVFARQPAPVQVSFAGYPESTGLEAIGYRLSDRWLEGAQMADGQWQMANGKSQMEDDRSRVTPQGERVYLLDSFWCYDPCGVDLPVNTLPALESRVVTFGSMNNFCKVNEPLLRLWARVLAAVPESRLVLLSRRGNHRQRTVEILEREGVAATRVEFADPGPRQAYMEIYHRLDMVLDPFPYNGHTTSLDALWMGVPVVSLAGKCAVSRAGWSQLCNLGLADLVAHSEDEYVAIARTLASDLPRLEQLRATLRPRMESSVLMDGPRFARQIEGAYRAMWQRWCASKPP